MAVLIKGMKMPENCYACPCGDNEWYECNVGIIMAAIDGSRSYHYDEYGYPDGERPDWCPLIEIPKQKTDDKLLEEAGFEL